MQCDPQGEMRIHMQQGANGLWDVHEVGCSMPIASFSDVEKCVDYATYLVKEKGGIVVQMLN